ncbi:MAG: hypothetical protein OEV66_07780 [Spirochaetia bacterium]|nr:hypothetical protein [Spirochaetia bacterium]
MKKIIAVIVFALAGWNSGCKSAQIESEVPTNNKDIANTYSAYKQMQGDFVLSGRANGKTFSYNGKINVENGKAPQDLALFMIIRDMIFQSPLSSMQIKDGKLLFKDMVNHVDKEYAYKDSSFVFYSNQEIPMEVLIPLFSGNLPDGLVGRGKANVDKSIYHLKAREYELAGFFKNSKLTTLIYSPPENYYQIIFESSGHVQNAQNRYFPEKIKVSVGKDEYFEITFKKIDIK